MSNVNKIAHHADLVAKMADTLGRDLDAGIVTDAAAALNWRSAVLSCTRCSNPEGCARFLETHDHADAAPDYCRNQRYLAGLPAKS